MASVQQSARFQASALDSSKLNEILEMLEFCKFPDSKWFQFGLKLRLSLTTLKNIEVTHGKDLGRCLMECLSKWLTKADGNVGPLTWETLSEALFGISENTVAEELIQIVANPACKLFQLYYVRLSQVSLPEESVQLLYTERVISSETLAEVKSHYGLLVGGPLRALLTTVAEDHIKLRVLATVLLRFDETQSLAKKLLDDYDKTFPSDHKVQDSLQLLPAADADTSAIVATRSQTVTTLELVVAKLNDEIELDHMKGMLGILLYNLTPLIEKSIKSVEDLKLFLRQCRPELKPQLAVAQTFDDVMKIIEEKCSIVNITLLEDIVKNYKIEEAVELISVYKATLHEFGSQSNSLRACDNVPLRQFSSSHLTCETITFTLNWDTDDHTLNDVNEFQTNAFQTLDRRVEVVVIKKANSIAVTCYAPHYLMESLLLIARENLDILKEMGLMSLIIGYYTVYDQQASDKEIIRLQEENNLLKKQYADLSETENDESDSDSDSSTSTDIIFVVPEGESVTFHHYSFEEMEEDRIQDEELLSDDQQGNTKGQKRSHPCDEEDPSVMSKPRKPHYSDDKSITVRDRSRKRGHPSSSDDMSPSKMIAREDDTDIPKQSLQEKEGEIDHLKLSLAEKEKEIETLHSSMKENTSTAQSAITDLMRKLQTQETLAKQKTREIEGLRAALRAKQLLTEKGKENESFYSSRLEVTTQFRDNRLKLIPSDFDQLLQSAGVFTEATDNVSIPDILSYATTVLTYRSLKDIISNPEFKIRVTQALVLFTGLPKSGKSKAFNSFVGQHVQSNLLLPLQMEYRPHAPDDISHYDLVAAADSESLQSLQLTKATKESSCIFGILSAFQQQLLKENVMPLVDSNDLDDESCFQNIQLNEHIQHIFEYLQSGLLNNDGKNFANGLMSIPDEYVLINMWDVPTNNIIHHILLQLQGHLTKNYLCQFLNLDRDLQNLQKPPEMERGGDQAITMKWRPRLHYLLRSCRLSDSQAKKRRNVVTIFAEYYESISNQAGIKRKVKELEDKVQTAAVHTGVSKLLNHRIEAIDVQRNLYPLSQNIKELVSKTQVEEIPIAWLFLRSFLHYSERKFITKKNLETLAMECGMDHQSLSDFCKFYMSFGSIFDLSLVDPHSQYVIVKPIHFLRMLNDFLRPRPSDDIDQHFPTIKLGIVPEKAGRLKFNEEWPAYEDALVSLKLATEVEIDRLELPAGSNIDPNSKCYYIPLSHTGPLMTDPDPHSIHLITSVNTPDVFKEVTLVEKLLKLLPQSKLVPCSNSNEIIIKDYSTGTKVTYVSYGPAVKLHLDRPNYTVCEAVVQVYDEIARNSDVTVKYMFVKMCIEEDIPNARYLPSAPYHILPTDKGTGLCDKCEREHDPKLLKVWDGALHKYPIQKKSKPSGQLKPEEKTSFTSKIASLNIDVIAKTFGFPNYREDQPSLKDMSGAHLINKLIALWERVIETTKGAQEPRRAFARKIIELRGNLLDQGEVLKGWTKKDFVELANSVDLYYIVDL